MSAWASLSDEDLSNLAELGDLVPDTHDAGLRGLTRTISGQYVEVVANFVRHSFAGDDVEMLVAQVRASMSALLRLAEASEDRALAEVIDDNLVLLPESRHRGGRRRERYMREMRDWVLRFSALLSPSDATRMKALVQFDERSQPLLHQLLEVYGIGPRRLERLYCGGLFSVETLVSADPDEVAEVTGMTIPLARSVHYAARRFDQQRREMAARALMDRAKDAVALAHESARSGSVDAAMLHAMREAMRTLEEALEELAPGSTERT